MGTGTRVFTAGRGSQLSSTSLGKLIAKFDLCSRDSGLLRSYFTVCLHYGGTHLGISGVFAGSDIRNKMCFCTLAAWWWHIHTLYLHGCEVWHSLSARPKPRGHVV